MTCVIFVIEIVKVENAILMRDATQLEKLFGNHNVQVWYTNTFKNSYGINV